MPAPWHRRAQTDIRTGVFWNEVASGFIAGLVARHTLEFERRTRGVLGKDVLTRLRDYVIAHIDEPIEVSTLEDSGAQPVPFYPVAHPIRWRQSAPLRRAFAMATSGRACSSCPIRLGRCRGAHRLCRPGHLTRWVRRVHGVSPTELVARAQRAGIFKISGSLFPKSRSRGAELPRSRRQTRKNNMTDLIERRFHRLGTQLSGRLSRPSDDHYATTTAIWGKAETTPLSDEKN